MPLTKRNVFGMVEDRDYIFGKHVKPGQSNSSSLHKAVNSAMTGIHGLYQRQFKYGDPRFVLFMTLMMHDKQGLTRTSIVVFLHCVAFFHNDQRERRKR